MTDLRGTRRAGIDCSRGRAKLGAVAELGKIRALFGAVLVVVGLALWFGPKVPWLGRLPGDIAIERGSFRFYFPLATCILISLVLTLIAWLFRKH